MAFLRRGNIKFPHRGGESVTLTRTTGQPQFFRLSDINCWEEHSMPLTGKTIVIVYHGLNSTAVEESFDDVTTAIHGKAVQP